MAGKNNAMRAATAGFVYGAVRGFSEPFLNKAGLSLSDNLTEAVIGYGLAQTKIGRSGFLKGVPEAMLVSAGKSFGESLGTRFGGTTTNTTTTSNVGW